MTQASVRIDAAIPQARAVSDALDLYSRMAMGQMSEIANLVAQGVIQIRDDGAPDGRRPADQAEVHNVEALCAQLAQALGHRTGSHFGIGRLREPARSAYEVQKAVDKAIADHENPGGHTVMHDGVTVRYTTHPAPRARIVGNEAD